MPAVQTTYAQIIAPARPGQVADATPNRVVSKIAQLNPIPFGSAVFRGTVDNGIMLAGTPGVGGFLGVAIIAPEVRPFGTVPDTYQPGDIAAIMEEGPVWIVSTTPVAIGAPVYVDATGAFTSTVTGNTAVPNSVFSATTAAAGLVRIRLRIG
jgi:hypothetical protein